MRLTGTCTTARQKTELPSWFDWAFRVILNVGYPAGVAIHHVGTVRRGTFDISAKKLKSGAALTRSSEQRPRFVVDDSTPQSTLNLHVHLPGGRIQGYLYYYSYSRCSEAFLHQSNPVHQWTLEIAWTRLYPLQVIVRSRCTAVGKALTVRLRVFKVTRHIETTLLCPHTTINITNTV